MRIAVIGAGCAGLGSAYYLRNSEYEIEIHEQADVIGGLSGSFEWHGFRLDAAPHRFFSRDEQLLEEVLALVPMRKVMRRSKVYLQGKWIQDPVNPVELVFKFFPRSLGLVRDYLFRKPSAEDSFESLVLSRYGAGLNRIFFKPYSEKLFGIPADQISAAWGRRKIRVGGFLDMLKRNTRVYFSHYYYPLEGGYGAICRKLYEGLSAEVRLESKLVGISVEDGGGKYVCHFDHKGKRESREYDMVISSLPITDLAQLFDFDMSLRFRPAKLVYLLINKVRVTPNQWFYFADSEHIINRVAEFKNIASEGFPPDQTVLCCEATSLERFSVDRVIEEMTGQGYIKPQDVLDHRVRTLDYAYPIYHKGYEEELDRVEGFFAQYPRLYRIGRHALFVHKELDEILLDAKHMTKAILAGGDATSWRSPDPDY